MSLPRVELDNRLKPARVVDPISLICISFVRAEKRESSSPMSNFGRAAATDVDQICLGWRPRHRVCEPYARFRRSE
jgi:hypothetical protein